MAVRRHRRRMRTGLIPVKRYIVPPAIVLNIQNRINNTGNNIFTGTTELDKIMNYFEQTIDAIIKQQSLTESINILQQIISNDTIKTQVQYYKIIEVIELDLLSMVMNIADGINPGIIAMRLEYIKSLIDIIPLNPQHIDELPNMLLQVIEDIIGGKTYTAISTNINQIKTYINEKYGLINDLILVQEMMLEIICNITEGVPSGIIRMRIERLRELITRL